MQIAKYHKGKYRIMINGISKKYFHPLVPISLVILLNRMFGLRQGRISSFPGSVQFGTGHMDRWTDIQTDRCSANYSCVARKLKNNPEEEADGKLTKQVVEIQLLPRYLSF